MAHLAGAYPGLCSMKRLGVSISTPPWTGCCSITESHPSIKFVGTHLYTCVERCTVTVKCLAQEHNTVSLARTQTQSTQLVESKHTNHEVYVNDDTLLHWIRSDCQSTDDSVIFKIFAISLNVFSGLWTNVFGSSSKFLVYPEWKSHACVSKKNLGGVSFNIIRCIHYSCYNKNAHVQYY